MDEELKMSEERRTVRICRRAMLRGLGGGAAAAALTAAAGEEAEAQVLLREFVPYRIGPRVDPMPVTRHTITTLGDGRVLLAGGFNRGALAIARIYHPSSGFWTEAAPMHEPRYFHAATALLDGRVLVVGGFNTGAMATAEIYDPRRDTWRQVAPMSAPRYHLSATTLRNGNVLVAGGWNVGPVGTLELFSPGQNRWRFARQ